MSQNKKPEEKECLLRMIDDEPLPTAKILFYKDGIKRDLIGLEEASEEIENLYIKYYGQLFFPTLVDDANDGLVNYKDISIRSIAHEMVETFAKGAYTKYTILSPIEKAYKLELLSEERAAEMLKTYYFEFFIEHGDPKEKTSVKEALDKFDKMGIFNEMKEWVSEMNKNLGYSE